VRHAPPLALSLRRARLSRTRLALLAAAGLPAAGLATRGLAPWRCLQRALARRGVRSGRVRGAMVRRVELVLLPHAVRARSDTASSTTESRGPSASAACIPCHRVATSRMQAWRRAARRARRGGGDAGARRGGRACSTAARAGGVASRERTRARGAGSMTTVISSSSASAAGAGARSAPAAAPATAPAAAAVMAAPLPLTSVCAACSRRRQAERAQEGGRADAYEAIAEPLSQSWQSSDYRSLACGPVVPCTACEMRLTVSSSRQSALFSWASERH